jgi:hypothetical protein
VLPKARRRVGTITGKFSIFARGHDLSVGRIALIPRSNATERQLEYGLHRRLPPVDVRRPLRRTQGKDGLRAATFHNCPPGRNRSSSVARHGDPTVHVNPLREEQVKNEDSPTIASKSSRLEPVP